PLAVSPLIVATAHQHVDFFPFVLPHVAGPNATGSRVLRYSVWIAQSYGPKFFQLASLLIQKRIVIRNKIMGCVTVFLEALGKFLLLLRLAANGVAAVRFAIDVNPQHAGK